MSLQVFTIVMVTPTMIKNIAWKTYLVFMACNFVIAPVIYFCFPETNGLTLEEVDLMFMQEGDFLGDSSSDSKADSKNAKGHHEDDKHIETATP